MQADLTFFHDCQLKPSEIYSTHLLKVYAKRKDFDKDASQGIFALNNLFISCDRYFILFKNAAKLKCFSYEKKAHRSCIRLF